MLRPRLHITLARLRLDTPEFLRPFHSPSLFYFLKWKGGRSDYSFVARVNYVKTLLYKDHIGPVKLIRTNKHGGPKIFTFLKDQALDAEAAYEESDQISMVTPIVVDKEILNGITILEI